MSTTTTPTPITTAIATFITTGNTNTLGSRKAARCRVGASYNVNDKDILDGRTTVMAGGIIYTYGNLPLYIYMRVNLRCKKHAVKIHSKTRSIVLQFSKW